MEKIIRLAQSADLEAVCNFLDKAEVGREGIKELIKQMVVIEDADKKLLATVGFQSAGENGLLRSLVIDSSLRQDYIILLFQSIMETALKKGVKNLYLATNKETSLAFFRLLKFEQVTYEEVPDQLKEIEHLKRTENSPALFFMRCRFG